MSLYTVDVQVPRKRSTSILALFEENGRGTVDIVSSNLLYADLKSAYYRLEVFTRGSGRDALETMLKQGGEDLSFRIREDVSVYEGPLFETVPARGIDFKKSFTVTTPAVLDLAVEELYARPQDTRRLSDRRIGLISDGSLFELQHRASVVLERDAYLLARHAQVQPFPLRLDNRNEEDLIRAVQALGTNFYAVRLSGLNRDYALEVVDRLDELMEVPIIHAESMERPVMMAAILQNAARIHGTEMSGKTAAVIGLGPEGVGILPFLERLGLQKIYGIDADLRQVSLFEKRGGIASSIDHVYDYADFVIVSPDVPGKLDEARFHEGQIVLSFSPGQIDLSAMPERIAARCYQGGEPHPVFVLPGLAGAVQRRKPERVTQELLVKIFETLVTKNSEAGFLPVPSQELFKTQFEAM